MMTDVSSAMVFVSCSVPSAKALLILDETSSDVP